MFFPGHIGRDATVNHERASGLVEDCRMTRKAEIVGADTADVQGFQTAEIIDVDLVTTSNVGPAVTIGSF